MKQLSSFFVLALLVSCPACFSSCRNDKVRKEEHVQEQSSQQEMQKAVSNKILHFEELNQTLKEVLEPHKVVVVDFFAKWCGPCKALGAQLPAIAEKFGDVKFVKVDVEESREVAEAQGVSSMPTLKIFKDGELFSTIIGWGHDSRTRLENALKEALK